MLINNFVSERLFELLTGYSMCYFSMFNCVPNIHYHCIHQTYTITAYITKTLCFTIIYWV